MCFYYFFVFIVNRIYLPKELLSITKDEEKLKNIMVIRDAHSKDVQKKHYILKDPEDEIKLAKELVKSVLGDSVRWPFDFMEESEGVPNSDCFKEGDDFASMFMNDVKETDVPEDPKRDQDDDELEAFENSEIWGDFIAKKVLIESLPLTDWDLDNQVLCTDIVAIVPHESPKPKKEPRGERPTLKAKKEPKRESKSPPRTKRKFAESVKKRNAARYRQEPDDHLHDESKIDRKRTFKADSKKIKKEKQPKKEKLWINTVDEFYSLDKTERKKVYETYAPDKALPKRRIPVDPVAHEYMKLELIKWQTKEGKSQWDRPYQNEWYWDLRISLILQGMLSKDQSADVCRSYLRLFVKSFGQEALDTKDEVSSCDDASL